MKTERLNEVKNMKLKVLHENHLFYIVTHLVKRTLCDRSNKLRRVCLLIYTFQVR